MLSFLVKSPPRLVRYTENPLILDDGASIIHFLTPKSSSDGFLVQQTFVFKEVEKLKTKGKNSVFKPPYHWHWNQIETFKVEKGAMLLTMDGKTQSITPKDGPVSVPNETYHSFDIDMSAKEDLVVSIWALPEYGVTESFFRNRFGYYDDCRRTGSDPSMFQLLVFTYNAEMSLGFPSLPKWAGKFVSRWGFGFLGGKIIGEKILGYKSVYEEYVDLENIKKKK